MTSIPPRTLRPILYTEDDENDAFLLRHAFRRAKIESPLLVVSDGRLAIEHLGGLIAAPSVFESECPRLILLDLNLPKLSGFDVLSWVRSQPLLKAIPVAIFSSSNQQRDLERATELGADAYFVKPSNLVERSKVVENIRARWLGI